MDRASVDRTSLVEAARNARMDITVSHIAIFVDGELNFLFNIDSKLKLITNLICSDLRGTTLEVCDQDDETCFCKKNVEGRDCSHCAAGTYNLQEKNPEGCTRCFCFGKTTRCENAYLRQMNVSMLSDMTLHTINITKTGRVENLKWIVDPSEPIMVNETTAQVYLADATAPELLNGYA